MGKSDLLPGTLEMLILRSLERNREPMHGYGVALFIKNASNDVPRDAGGSPGRDGGVIISLTSCSCSAWSSSQRPRPERSVPTAICALRSTRFSRGRSWSWGQVSTKAPA